MLIDLFSGGGGVLRGAHMAGLTFDLAVDVDPILTSASVNNFPNTRHLLHDLSTVTAEQALEWTNGREVDLIVGGPPCQGFSLIGRRDSSDPRRNLLDDFFRLVAALKPKAFVMENVAGLASPKTMPLLEASLDRWVANYELLEPKILDAADYGAPTRRKRIFVVGYDRSRCEKISWGNLNTALVPVTVRDAIWDLQGCTIDSIDGAEQRTWKLDGRRAQSAYAKRLRRSDGRVTGCELTTHTPQVLKRFSELLPGRTDPVGRYPRLDWNGHCPTLRAGTGSDYGSHQAIRPIHPVEDRVITAREGARLQGFPDWHEFHDTKWHTFRMIGNSVSPPIAKAIFEWLREPVSLSERPPLLQAAE